MTRICSFRKYILIFLFLSFPVFLNAADKNWVIAADKFVSGNDDSSVSTALCEIIPRQIIDSLAIGKTRLITAEEEFSRAETKLKTDRISLFLQLEAAVKTRDALVLKNYSDLTLKNKIKAEDQKIQEIKDKINKNLEEVKTTKVELEKRVAASNKTEVSELEKYKSLFKGLVSTKQQHLSEENVLIYDKGDSCFYSYTTKDGTVDYSSESFSKQAYAAGISSILTGKVTVAGDFVFVTSELFVYPSGKSLCTVSEIGSLEDVDFIAGSIAHSLSPVISASLPVKLLFSVEPEEARNNITFVIDDVVYKKLNQEYVLDSGVHTVRFDAPGFKTVSTSYFFEGNGVYCIDVDMKEKTERNIKLTFPKTGSGNFILNGNVSGFYNPEEDKPEIKINDSKILGVFVVEDGTQSFFEIPEKLLKDNAVVSVNTKLWDKSDFIDNRRRMMYTSYSVFLVSLLGTVFTYGNYVTTGYGYLNSGYTSYQLYNETKNWQTASYVCAGVSAGAAVWFCIELARYLAAADSVLPVKAKEKKE